MRWLWRGALTEEHQGGTAVTRKTLKLVADAPRDESAAQSLLRSLTTPRPAFIGGTAFNFRHARSKLITIALLDLSPRDLATGEPVLVSQLVAADDDQIPQLIRKRPNGPSEQRLIQDRLACRRERGVALARRSEADAEIGLRAALQGKPAPALDGASLTGIAVFPESLGAAP